MSAESHLHAALKVAEESLVALSMDDTAPPRKALDKLLRQLGGRIPEEVRDAWRTVVSELADFADSKTVSAQFPAAVQQLQTWLADQRQRIEG
jgi:hypothetical protein